MQILALLLSKTPFCCPPVLAPPSVPHSAPLTEAAPLLKVLLAIVTRVVVGAFGWALPTIPPVPPLAPLYAAVFNTTWLTQSTLHNILSNIFILLKFFENMFCLASQIKVSARTPSSCNFWFVAVISLNTQNNLPGKLGSNSIFELLFAFIYVYWPIPASITL